MAMLNLPATLFRRSINLFSPMAMRRLTSDERPSKANGGTGATDKGDDPTRQARLNLLRTGFDADAYEKAIKEMRAMGTRGPNPFGIGGFGSSFKTPKASISDQAKEAIRMLDAAEDASAVRSALSKVSQMIGHLKALLANASKEDIAKINALIKQLERVTQIGERKIKSFEKEQRVRTDAKKAQKALALKEADHLKEKLQRLKAERRRRDKAELEAVKKVIDQIGLHTVQSPEDTSFESRLPGPTPQAQVSPEAQKIQAQLAAIQAYTASAGSISPPAGMSAAVAGAPIGSPVQGSTEAASGTTGPGAEGAASAGSEAAAAPVMGS